MPRHPIMTNKIPVFSIDNFSNKKEIFYIETQYDTKNIPLHLPYRTEYYGFGIVVSGNGTFDVNLESYKVHEGSIITISPEVIKQWKHRSSDLQTITIFFTKSFFVQHNLNQYLLDSFSFFNSQAQHIISFSKEKSDTIKNLLYNIKDRINSVHLYKNEIITNLLNMALYEYAVLYSEHTQSIASQQNRSRQISIEFKNLVTQHFIKQRKIKFYADLLFISPKHLSEIIKVQNGKTAGEWIDEMVVLEAKILLQDPTLSIAQIAEQLNFTDPSVFGKFFKNLTHLSPLAYRQTL